MIPYQIPPGVTPEAAATIPVALAVAVSGLYAQIPHGAELVDPFDASGRGKYAGKPFVLIGGATSVGQYGTQPRGINNHSSEP